MHLRNVSKNASNLQDGNTACDTGRCILKSERKLLEEANHDAFESRTLNNEPSTVVACATVLKQNFETQSDMNNGNCQNCNITQNTKNDTQTTRQDKTRQNKPMS